MLGHTDRSGDYWQSISEGVKNEWKGFAFERVCLWHIPQIKAALGISGVHVEAYSCPNGLERNMYSHAVQSEVTMDALFR